MEKMQTGLVNPQVVMKLVLESEEQPNIEQLMDVPPPQPSFEVTKHQQEMQYKYAALTLETMDKEETWINNEILAKSKAMLDIANSEAAEVGSQLNEYRAELDVLIKYSEESALRRKEFRENSQANQQQTQPNQQVNEPVA